MLRAAKIEAHGAPRRAALFEYLISFMCTISVVNESGRDVELGRGQLGAVVRLGSGSGITKKSVISRHPYARLRSGIRSTLLLVGWACGPLGGRELWGRGRPLSGKHPDLSYILLSTHKRGRAPAKQLD